MKIAVDVRETVHEKAGKGYYTTHLVEEILNQDSQNSYILYSDCPVETFQSHPNAELRLIKSKGIKWHMAVLKDVYKENVDIFFAPTSFIIPSLHNPKKIKVLITVHDLISFLYPSHHNKKAVITERLTLKKALKKVERVLAVSENTKQDLIKRFKFNADKIDVVMNAASDIFQPLEKDTLDRFKEEKNIPDKFIFSAGTLEPRKNFPMLIRSYAAIKKDLPEYKLLIAGKKGWYFEEIFKTVEELELEEDVRFLGYVYERDLVYLYNLATIFVYPSLYEGFGIPPLEAMQSGCPVITSNTSSLPEVVGQAALLVNPNSEKELTEAIKMALKNEEFRKELRKKGFYQSRKFSWKESAQKFLDIIRHL